MTTNCKILLLLLLAPVVLLLARCTEKGCTNKLAINYNITANKDDGSCMVCKLTGDIQDTASVSIVDENGSSQFFGQEVARVIVTQTTLSYNFSECDTSTVSTGNCELTFTVVNLVNEKMTASFIFEGSINNSISFEQEITNLVIPANSISSSQAITNASNPCGTLTENNLEAFDGNFTYK